MDKRKVNGGMAAGEDLDGRAAKRRKPDHKISLSEETHETTTKIGLELVELVKRTADKSGRLIATSFLTLPSKRQLPDYYQVTKLPVALDIIENKLKRREFPTLTTLESLFKRMITNAKEYNEKGSEVYDDSERLRKVLSHFMNKNNPAYDIPGYVAFPTPLPGTTNDEGSEKDADGEPDPEVESLPRRKASRPSRQSGAQAPRSSITPSRSEIQYVGVGFNGLNFQQAQEKILEEIITKKELEGDDFSAFEPFLELPSRSDYRDYYKVIPHPVSLKVLQKRVKGVQGRGSITGISDFKSWAAFEEEASYIWKNAFHYNEDGSDIFVLAKELETYFKKLLHEAKSVVSEPAGTKIKLKLPEATPKITLKFGGGKASPAESPAPQTAPPVAPQINGVNGFANGLTRRNPFNGSQSSSTPGPSLDQLERARSASGSAPSPALSNSGPMINDDVARNSPGITALNNYGTQGAPTPGMPPPLTPGLPNVYTPSGYAQSFNHHVQYSSPNPSFDSKWRQPGKNASDAMITNLSLATHPGLNISRHFRMDLPPSQTMAQQSMTINLPSTHYYLQIKPTIASSVMERQYKLFVTSGTQRLHAMPTIPGHPVDPQHPLFEARLLPGVNRIEVELIAALPKGTKVAAGQDVELEKITIFANLMRS